MKTLVSASIAALLVTFTLLSGAAHGSRSVVTASLVADEEGDLNPQQLPPIAPEGFSLIV